ncbi:flagellar basal-body rod protein FlgF [Mangrovitalea sediminis]|uniref:flagellar basal-body rod protein FlgF n=1 Tax=Mangrovitalea sediminis TaxID=1982043 RepID=UPI000BE5727B|nr:flagellar basal-body rod protein FlgF [Mangrovitalea sediminis]
MDKALYIAMSGAKQNMLAQQAHANNLANVDTVGFKQDFVAARSMPVYGETYPSRVFAMTENPGTDMSSGSLIQTGRDLDIAIKGKGWIAVQAPDGSEAYTRAGNLQVDVNGILRTGSGLPVLGNGGPVAIPPSDKVQIGADGTVSAIPTGSTPSQLVEVDRIKLVNPDPKTLEKGTDGLMHIKSQNGGNAVAPADANVRVEPGFLEDSNVNPIEALISTMQLSRQYELQVRVMHAADQDSQSTARLLQNL